MEIENNKNHPNKTETDSKIKSSPVSNSQEKKSATQTPAQDSDVNAQPERKYWGVLRIADIIQMISIIITAVTLIAFIYVSVQQIAISNRAISQTDNVITYTKRSIEINEKNILSSDLSTKEALRISDSSLSISRQSMLLAFENINTIRQIAKTELRAFVQVDSIYFHQYEVGKMVKINIRLTNVGKTPAYNLKVLLRSKWGGTGIYLTDYKTLKDTVSRMTIPANNGYLTLYDNVGNMILEKSDSIGIANGKLFLGYYAKVFYEDIFGQQDSVIVCREYDNENHFFELCNSLNEIQKPR